MNQEPNKGAPAKAEAAAGVNRRYRKRLALVLAGALALVLLCMLTGYTYLYPNIHFGIQAGGISVGGMKESEAAAAIEKEGASLIAGQAIDLSIYGNIYEVRISEVADGLDSRTTAQEAYAYTRAGNPFSRMGRVLGALFGGGNTDLTVAVNQEALSARLDEISEQALTPPVDPSFSLEGGVLLIDKGEPGVDFDRGIVSAAVTENIRRMDFSPYEVETTERQPQPVDLAAIKEQVDTSPVNATVDKTDGKTILPSVDGVSLDVEQAQAIINGSPDDVRIYEIPVTLTPAKVSAEQLRGVLFRDTLGAASTSFASSGASRANNVVLASSFIHNVILNPGDEFSYNGVVGERTTARGFKTAGAYSAGKVVDEVGGGVCQPSSTLYMAVLRADLKVSERTNHGFTVAYTPLGEDATVSYGALDFRFINDTDYPIKIVVDSSGRQLRMSIVGTKTSDKVVTMEREVLATYPAQTIEKEDPSLPAGTRTVEQTASTGYKVNTYKVITENGQTTRIHTNTSTYKKRDQIVIVGTKAVESAAVETPPAGDENTAAPDPAPTAPLAEPEAPSGGTGDTGNAADSGADPE